MFRSFFMAGFECATGFNRHGQWIDQVAATGHDRHLDQDYSLVREAGIHVVREGVRWPIVDQGYGYRFDSLRSILRAARRSNIQLILDLFHYGYPQDLDIFSPSFVYRFAEYCRSVAMEVGAYGDVRCMFTPVNEPSYFAWAAGDAGLFFPHAFGRSFELKVQLARAAIAGIDAIRSVLPSARIVNVDPLCRVVAPEGRPDFADEVHSFNEHVVFQSWDMIAGRLMPELGGSPQHLDILGLNYYWTNQWEHTRPEIPLPADDPRAWPVRDLIRWVWHRYGHEMLISETAHVGENRAKWIRSLTTEMESVLDEGIPLKGVCLYPALGMPEWHDQSTWTNMGLWDLSWSEGALQRTSHLPSMAALRAGQERLEGLSFTSAGFPRILSGDPYMG